VKTSNIAVDRIAGSHSLAAAGHRWHSARDLVFSGCE